MNEKTIEQSQVLEFPAFIDCGDDLITLLSSGEAESFFESDDLDEPATIYDATGQAWRYTNDDQEGDRNVGASAATEVPELEDIIRRRLQDLKAIGRWSADEEWLTAASLETLVSEAAAIELRTRWHARLRGLALVAMSVAGIATGGLVWCVIR